MWKLDTCELIPLLKTNTFEFESSVGAAKRVCFICVKHLMNVHCAIVPLTMIAFYKCCPPIYDKRSLNTMSIYLPILLFSVVSFAAGRRLFKTFLQLESQP